MMSLALSCLSPELAKAVLTASRSSCEAFSARRRMRARARSEGRNTTPRGLRRRGLYARKISDASETTPEARRDETWDETKPGKEEVDRWLPRKGAQKEEPAR